MPFLSELLNKTVYDSRNEAVGKCVDVHVNPDEGFPAVVAVGLLRGGQEFLISALDLSRMDHKGIALTGRLRDLTLYEPQGGEIGLAKQVLDRQIIDINGKRVVRVNDLQFAYANGKYRLVAVDATPTGLARRVGLERPINKLLKTIGGRAQGSSIPWDQVDPTAIGPAGVPLKVARNDLTEMHPADLADIVEQLDIEAGDYVLSTLDTEFAADTLQEIDDPERQASALESIEPERAADILEAMPPDEAADVLGDISAARAADLLSRMDKEDAEDVRELLAYPEDSTGGIMTTEYIAIPSNLTGQQTIEHLRQLSPDAETIYYLYVTDPEERLIGVISLRDLIIAQPDQIVREFMTTPVIHVEANDSQEEVAAVLAKYNLLAVPVTDPSERMLGIVTVDDAIESVIPGAWKRRLPRVFGG
ncbi:MAG TPA: CBS domain-containing protein [Chloroflexia bacterium]|nr:CBS domain-containing protein [Chloroflexia bacterium]